MDSLHCPPSYAPSVHGSRPLCSSQLLLAASSIAGLLPAQVPSSQPVFPIITDIAPPEAQPTANAESLLFAGFAQLLPAQQEVARATAEVMLKAVCSYLLQDMKQSEFLNSSRRFTQAMLHLNGKALPPDQELIRAERKQSANKLSLDMADTDLKLARLIIQQFVADSSKRSGGRHE